MNYRNKLMSLSLIALAVFSACTNEMENGTHPGKGDQRLSFAVSMGGTNAWKPTAARVPAVGFHAFVPPILTATLKRWSPFPG